MNNKGDKTAMETEERYYYIKSKITKAKDSNNNKSLRLWKAKLEDWQLEYGAYQPITINNYNKYE